MDASRFFHQPVTSVLDDANEASFDGVILIAVIIVVILAFLIIVVANSVQRSRLEECEIVANRILVSLDSDAEGFPNHVKLDARVFAQSRRRRIHPDR